MADDPRANRPESGTYGEKADLQRLRQSLPAMDPQPPQPGVPGNPLINTALRQGVPTHGRPGRPQGPQPPAGVPASVMRPTDRPTEPVASMRTVADTAPIAAAQSTVTATQQRLAVLDALANSPDVGAKTREWARMVMGMILNAGKQ